MRSEDHVEPVIAELGEHGGRIGDVGADEAGLDGEFARQAPGVIDCLLGEVDPRDPGAAARPRQGVQPEVALQMEQRLALDFADPIDLDRVEGVSTGA